MLIPRILIKFARVSFPSEIETARELGSIVGLTVGKVAPVMCDEVQHRITSLLTLRPSIVDIDLRHSTRPWSRIHLLIDSRTSSADTLESTRA